VGVDGHEGESRGAVMWSAVCDWLVGSGLDVQTTPAACDLCPPCAFGAWTHKADRGQQMVCEVCQRHGHEPPLFLGCKVEVKSQEP